MRLRETFLGHPDTEKRQQVFGYADAAALHASQSRYNTAR